MTEAEKAAEAFVGAPSTPEQMKLGYRIEYQAFLAGAAWQREQVKMAWAYVAGWVNIDAFPANHPLREMEKLLSDEQSNQAPEAPNLQKTVRWAINCLQSGSFERDEIASGLEQALGSNAEAKDG